MRRFLLAFALVFAWIGPGFSAQRLAQVNPSTNQSFLAESFWANASPVFYTNLAATNSVPSGLVYASAGARWCWNSSGSLVQLAANVPCFDYDPATLLPRGIRSEPQRVNLLTYSSSFTAGWTNSSGATTLNYAMSPDGTTDAARVQLNLSAAFFQTLPLSSGTAYTLSFYVKATSSAQNFQLAYYNGTVTTTQNFTSTASWARYTYTFTASSSVASNLGVRAGGNTVDVLVWGAQLEANGFATSPILTYGTAVTVPADQWSFTGAALAALQAPTTCHVIEFTPEGVNSVNPLIKSNTTGSFGSAFVPSLTQVALANVTQVAGVSTTPSAGVLNRVAAAGAPGAYAVAVNGVLGTGTYAGAQTPGSAYGLGAITGAASSMWVSQIAIRSRCTALQARRYSTAGVNLLASLADNDNDLPLVVKIASGEW